ncbi:hypothetical protein AB7M32_001730 [Pseudomonas sp. R151218B TE3479]
MWRGSLLPLGREAAPSFPMPDTRDCFAAQREQAPSPQQHPPEQGATSALRLRLFMSLA